MRNADSRFTIHTPRTHTLQVRARYCECDPMGLVHHASYIPWLEMGRTELLRATGSSYAQLEASGLRMVIVSLDVSYKGPARYDDVIEVVTRVKSSGPIKIIHEYELRVVEQSAHGPKGEVRTEKLCLTASTTLACLNETGRIVPVPAFLADARAPKE